MEIVNKKLTELIPYKNNPRKNDEAVKYVANSIRDFGFKVPIVIDKNNVIVAGHTRFKASQQLGLKEVPCIVADDLTEEQIKAFRLADNKVSEFAEWDDELLLEEVELIDLDLTDYGFPEIQEEVDSNDEEEEELFDDIDKLDTHYGVSYQGNKSRIADIIINILPSGKRLVDLFGGGVLLPIVECYLINGNIIYTMI